MSEELVNTQATKKKSAGKTEGFATLELVEGLRHLNVKASVYKSEKDINDPTKYVDDPDATRVRDFQYDALPGQMQKLTIHYSFLGETYWKHPDIQILYDIQRELKIKYPKDHPSKPHEIIDPYDIDPTDYHDYFFQEFKLIKLNSKHQMKGGVYTFSCADPVDRLLFYAYMYHPDTEVKGEEIDTLRSGRTRWRLIMPEKEKKEKLQENNTKITAISLLDKKRGIEPEKQKMIAEILRTRLDFQKASADDVRIGLMTQIVDTNKRFPRWNKNGIDLLIYLGDVLTNTQLQKVYTISKALQLSVITRTADTYRFNEEVIPNVASDPELFEYFFEKENEDTYRDVVDFTTQREIRRDEYNGK